MTAARQLELISVEEFLAREEAGPFRREYVAGNVYDMAGGKVVHNDIAVSLVSSLNAQLRGKPCRPYGSDMMLRLRKNAYTRFYYPDCIVVCEPSHPDATYQEHPTIVAEVLSDSTRRIDEGEKLEGYLSIPSLRVYLVIESDQPRVVAHRRTESGFISELYEGREAVIPLPEVGVDLSLAELYERVEF